MSKRSLKTMEEYRSAEESMSAAESESIDDGVPAEENVLAEENASASVEENVQAPAEPWDFKRAPPKISAVSMPALTNSWIDRFNRMPSEFRYYECPEKISEVQACSMLSADPVATDLLSMHVVNNESSSDMPTSSTTDPLNTITLLCSILILFRPDGQTIVFNFEKIGGIPECLINFILNGGKRFIIFSVIKGLLNLDPVLENLPIHFDLMEILAALKASRLTPHLFTCPDFNLIQIAGNLFNTTFNLDLLTSLEKEILQASCAFDIFAYTQLPNFDAFNRRYELNTIGLWYSSPKSTTKHPPQPTSSKFKVPFPPPPKPPSKLTTPPKSATTPPPKPAATPPPQPATPLQKPTLPPRKLPKPTENPVTQMEPTIPQQFQNRPPSPLLHRSPPTYQRTSYQHPSQPQPNYLKHVEIRFGNFLSEMRNDFHTRFQHINSTIWTDDYRNFLAEYEAKLQVEFPDLNPVDLLYKKYRMAQSLGYQIFNKRSQFHQH